jgi:hypothetical protein
MPALSVAHLKTKEIPMRKIALITILLCLATTQAMAREVGTSAADFLKVGLGARPAGMGSAFVAIADDNNAIEWNPAGLSQLTPDYFDAQFEHVFWFGDVEYENLSYAQYLGDTYGAGVQLLYRHMPDIDNNLEDESPQKVYDFAAILGYGFQISNFSIGLNLKFVNDHLGTVDLYGEAADLGMMVHFLDRKLSVGLAVQNLGPDIEADSLPLNIRAGFAYQDVFGENREHAINTCLEVDQPLDNKLNLLLGVEYWYMKVFGARLGYRQQLGGSQSPLVGFAIRLCLCALCGSGRGQPD